MRVVTYAQIGPVTLNFSEICHGELKRNTKLSDWFYDRLTIQLYILLEI